MSFIMHEIADSVPIDPQSPLLLKNANPEPEPKPRPGPVIDAGDPLPAARAFIEAWFMQSGYRILHHHAGDFYLWSSNSYRHMEAEALRQRLYEWAERAETPKGGPFSPTKPKIDRLLDAVRAIAFIPCGPVPRWLDGEGDDASDLLLVANGVLHIPTGELRKPNPRFFSTIEAAVEYDPDAPVPTRWMQFLDELWPDDDDAKKLLQQWVGYLLTVDTRHHKIMLIVGPPRSGKGTLARVAGRLLGEENICAPTLAGLCTNFGLQSLIGKTAAFISDARLSGRSDQAVIAERLLSISGEDRLGIDRKHRDPVTVRLPVRFTILTNELPMIGDSSGALASRFLVLTINQSWLGREDHNLTDALLDELPGILNWAIEGWRQLRRAGRFTMPGSSEEAVAELDALGSPVKAFVADQCELRPGASVPCEELYREWCQWCSEQGRDHPGTLASFSRNLHAACPGIKTDRRQVNGERQRWFEGIWTQPVIGDLPV